MLLSLSGRLVNKPMYIHIIQTLAKFTKHRNIDLNKLRQLRLQTQFAIDRKEIIGQSAKDEYAVLAALDDVYYNDTTANE